MSEMGHPEPTGRDAGQWSPSAGLAAARRRAQWELGDPSWADTIIKAYLHPDESDASLDVWDTTEER